MLKPKREPRTPEPTREPPKPQWFVEKDYSYLNQLDAEGWYAELTRLYKLSVDHELGLHGADPNIHVTTDAGVTNIVQVGTPTLLFIGPRSEGFTLTREWLPALIVNVNAPSDCMGCALRHTVRPRTR